MKRKPMRVRQGKVKELAEICGASEVTVRHALRWTADSDMQNLIRKKAQQLGFVRQF